MHLNSYKIKIRASLNSKKKKQHSLLPRNAISLILERYDVLSFGENSQISKISPCQTPLRCILDAQTTLLTYIIIF
jgi:hypothetical protein